MIKHISPFERRENENSLFLERKKKETKVISSLIERRMKMISPRLKRKLLKPFSTTPSEMYP